MKLGFIAYNDLPNLERDCVYAVAQGYEGLEFNHWGDFVNVTPDDCAARRAVLDRYGIACSSFGIWGFNHLSADADERAAAHAQVPKAIECAAVLGADILILGAGGKAGAAPAEQAAEFAEAMGPYLAQANDAGLTVACYGFHGGSAFLESIEAYEALFAAVPNVGIKFDPANIQHAGHDYLRMLRNHGDRVYHVHIKEHLYHDGALASQPAAGMGDIAWGKVFAFLYEAGYDGWLTVEPHGNRWSSGPLRWTMLALTARHIRQFLL